MTKNNYYLGTGYVFLGLLFYGFAAILSSNVTFNLEISAKILIGTFIFETIVEVMYLILKGLNK